LKALSLPEEVGSEANAGGGGGRKKKVKKSIPSWADVSQKDMLSSNTMVATGKQFLILSG
jgi:hypothetical protein